MVVVGLLTAGGLVLIFRPSPVSVQTATVHRGTLQEITEEEGKTRMHDHFILAATVSGKLRRIDLHAGDAVRTGETVAWIDPAPIDPRQNAVLEARLRATRAAKQQADAVAERTQTNLLQAEKDLARARALGEHGIISKESLDRAVTLYNSARQELQAAQSSVQAATFQVEEAQSALLVSRDGASDLPTPVRTPANGRVLRLIEQSERVVSPGTPILEIGYTPRLEIVVDFLTRDAVRIKPGMPALITDWGGDSPLRARVRMVEPSGFTKVSSLGIEEQRVNVICDFEGNTGGLEDGYHVQVQVITWEGANALLVPSGAVFRSGSGWSVFKVSNGAAHKTAVTVGHRSDEQWEAFEGLTAGDEIVVHPSTELKDGDRVKAMERR